MDIRSDRQKGPSCTELGKKYHMDPRTAKRHADSPQRPKYTLTGPKPAKLGPYKHKIEQWLDEAPYSAVRILEKPQEQGFDGRYSIEEYVWGKKMDLDEKATARFETLPGKQVALHRISYQRKDMVVNPHRGRRKDYAVDTVRVQLMVQ